jgi:AraC-like DNA-binding protein
MMIARPDRRLTMRAPIGGNPCHWADRAEHSPRTVWSTADVGAEDANDYWTDVVCDALVQVHARPVARTGFAGRIEHAVVDGVGFSLVTSGAQQVDRTRSLIARGQEGCALVNIQTEGQGHVAQDGRATTLPAGAMTLVDSSRPYSLRFAGAFSQLIVQVPLRMLPRGALARASAVDLGSHGPGRLIADFLVGLERQHRRDPQAAASLVPHAIGLIDCAVGWAVGAEPGAKSSTALSRERIHHFIKSHAHDADLSADAVAAACGLSRRTMFRALSAAGESFTSLLRQARVARVQQLLRAMPNRPLAMVSHECGFAGVSQMHRAFRAVSGTTPAAYRAMPITGGAGPEHLSDRAPRTRERSP